MVKRMLNPFIYGKPVPSEKYIDRRRELRTLFSRLRNGECTAVVGEPHIGKSSLLRYIQDQKVQQEWLGQEGLQVIITSGGTGVSHRDVTIETVLPILEKKLDGFGELFRSLSYQEIGTASIMSRAIAGVAGGKVILCLPGSLGAANLAMDRIILPEIGHMVREATR